MRLERASKAVISVDGKRTARIWALAEPKKSCGVTWWACGMSVHGTGGHILQLIQQEKGLSFREALNYAAWFWGSRESVRETSDSEEVASSLKEAQKDSPDLQRELEKELHTALQKDSDLPRGLMLLNPQHARDLERLTQSQETTSEKDRGR